MAATKSRGKGRKAKDEIGSTSPEKLSNKAVRA